MSKPSPWTQANVKKTKKHLRELIESHCKDLPAREKLEFIKSKIIETEQKCSHDSDLKQVIYIISALVHHERFGGLTPRQVQQFTDKAYALLQINSIKPGTSKLSSFFGELHLVRGQIFRKLGDHWIAAWEQQFGLQQAKALPPGGLGFQSLVIANRSLRLGNTKVALHYYSKAKKEGINEFQTQRANIGILRALRLSYDLREAEKFSKHLLQDVNIDEKIKEEITWEAVCRHVTETKDLKTMLRIIRKKASHHVASYIWECFMWASSVNEYQSLKRTLKLRNFAKNNKINLKPLGLQVECGLTIERCYDYDYPLTKRYHDLGQILSQSDKLLNIDKQLLLWTAASRWLARCKSFALSTLVLNEYRAMSLRLTDGNRQDVLGIVSDLYEKPWYLNEQAQVL